MIRKITNEQMKTAILSLLLAVCCQAWASEKPARQMQYWPEGRSIVCVNGNNRYTRALYGSHTLFRLETSDRPVFATYDKGKSKNIRFFLTTNGKTVRLDSTDYCRASYQGGQRDYIVRHHDWGKDAELHITALASQEEETALWQLTASGFESDVVIDVRVCAVAKPKMSREGDLGMEPRDSYEAASNESGLQTLQLMLSSHNGKTVESFVWLADNETIIAPDYPTGKERMAKELDALHTLTSTVQFTTPDPFINTLGSNLVAAADGLWDGTSWLHGCIGWRMPLAGWRAAYLADAIGWNDRAISHFNAYAASQVTNVPPVYPHPSQDKANNLARAEEKWGTQMYSNGYICRYPDRNDKMHHYDMNLNYVDELLWHFCYDADTAYMRKMFPLLKLHLEWEKRNFDPDGDHLYDAYCCIWASDALYYNSGAVTHSSAYNYRGNLLTARIAEIIGEDPTPFRTEAEAILKAMNSRLWLTEDGHWAEFQDFMGLKRLHKSAALWSIYTPIDCGACSAEQAYLATRYVDTQIPHIPIRIEGSGKELAGDGYFTLSTTDWMPYDWSTNNVAHEEVMNMALAYFKAGRNEMGFRLLKGDILDGQFLGMSPGNFGQISYYDKARSEAYRDFGDNVGISARAIINGLFGVQPDALNGRCTIQPGFPASWDSVSFKTPYLSYRFYRKGKQSVYEITQNFSQPLQIVLRLSKGNGLFHVVNGTQEKTQTLVVDEERLSLHDTADNTSASLRPTGRKVSDREMGVEDIDGKAKYVPIDISSFFNANVDDIFRNEYLTPRSPYTTLEIPVQGIGQWCLPKRTAEIEDNGLRANVKDGYLNTGLGNLRFLTPAVGQNIIYTSLWDNYPDSVVIPLKGKAAYACLLLAGSTNNMQSRIDNGIVVATYKDGTSDTLRLENPTNWCPIEQEYFIDGLAFRTDTQRPYRVHLGSGKVARELGSVMSVGSLNESVKGNPDSAEPRYIESGAGQILRMPLNPRKKLKNLTIRTLSNDVVIGLMAVSLEK